MDLDALITFKNNFIHALQEGEKGNPTSMPFIIHELPSSSVVKPGETFQVISIGGTNYQTGYVQVTHDDELNLKKEEVGERPTFRSEEEFLQFMSGIIDQSVDYVGLNFAFPLYPEFRDGLLDGTLKGSGKNDDFGDLVGKLVGKSIEEYIGNAVRVSAANDTICLLLSGSARYQREKLSAIIVGTGYNAAYFIDPTHPVNTQATSFSGYKPSELALEVDKIAENKGALFEKDVAGAYLYQQFNITPGIQGPIQSSDELDEIAGNDNHPDCLIARKIFEHSAQLVSTHVAGIMQHKQSDMTFVMQGSVYWKAWNYQEMVDEWVKKLCPQHNATFCNIDDADMWGAAYLLL